MRPSTIRALTLLVVLLALTLITSSAQAIVLETSQITTPSGTTYPLYYTGSEGPAITVAGTVTGMTEVDVRCYSGPTSYTTLAEDVPVTGTISSATFSTSFPRSDLEHAVLCRLRAVPTGLSSALPPSEDTEFKGPMLAPGYFNFESHGADANSYSLGGGFFVEPLGCGIESSLTNATTLEQSQRLFYCNGGLEDEPPTGPSPISTHIDGSIAYQPEGAEGINSSTPTLPKVTYSSISYDETSGNMSFIEHIPFVRCSPEANAVPTGSSCSSFAETGVTLEQTWTTSAADHIATAFDVWRSTDGKAHEVNIDYFNEFEQEGTKGAFLFPGTTAFAGTTAGETVTLPATAATILVKYNASTPEAGNGIEPQGAIVYDRAPSGPLTVTHPTSEAEYDIYDAPYTFVIPAGGTSDLRTTYIQGFSMEEVRAEAAAAATGYAPTISIATPTTGTSLETEAPTVAVSGTASDSGALTSVSVNGAAATLAANGSWTATATLKPGANTITATATDEAGLSASAAVLANYKIPPGKATLSGPITTNKGDVSFTLRCAGAAGATCTVKDGLTTIERRHRTKILGLLAKITKRTLTIASGHQTIAAGKELKITLTLNRTGKALLKRFHKLPGKLTVTIATATAKPATAIARTITITPPKKKRKDKH